MPSITTYLQTAALTALAGFEAGTGTYSHESRVQATLTANTSPLPLIVSADFVTDQKATTDRVTRAFITLHFGDVKPGQGDDAVAEANTVARMDKLKQRFLSALDTNPFVEISNMKATPFHNYYEAELTGVGMQFTLGVPAATLIDSCLV